VPPERWRTEPAAVAVRAARTLVDVQIAPGLVDALIAFLTDRDAEVRRTAAEALGRCGRLASSAVPALIRALAAREWGAFWALVEIAARSPGSWDLLLAAARDADPATREASIAILGKVRCPHDEVMTVLVGALGDSDAAVRKAAVDALDRFGARAAPAVDALVIALGQVATATDARDALAAIGDAAFPAVSALLTGPNDANRAISVDTLGRMCAPASIGTAAFASLLSDRRPDVRAAAVTMLGNVGPACPASLPRLLAALSDPDVSVQESACSGLVRFGAGAEPALPRLRELLRADSSAVHAAAIEVLENLGPAGAAAVPELMAVARDGGPWVQGSAWRALASVAAASPAARDACLAALLDRHRRHSLETVLSRLGVGGIGVLVDSLRADDPDLRRVAVRALGEMPALPAAAEEALAAALCDSDSQVGYAAQTALEARYRAHVPPRLVPLLVRGVDYGRDSRRWRVHTLLKRAAPEVIPALLSRVRHEDAGVRATAMHLLECVAPVSELRAARHIAEGDHRTRLTLVLRLASTAAFELRARRCGPSPR